MSSSNHHYHQRRPGVSPTPRKRHLDPGLESNPKRRGTDRDINARFDEMIETMSLHSGLPRYSHRKNRKRIGRTHSHKDDAYTLPTPEHLQNGLSFVKMDAAISPSPVLSDARSSDSAQVSHTSISHRRSCSLPEWLANTFMSLSKKHPLRLLLPSDLAQACLEEPRSKGTQANETDGLFTFIDAPPAPENPYEEHNGSEFQRITPCDDSAMDSSDSDLPEPLPYSTPGPGSSLGGFSVAHKPALSAVSLQTSSSPTLFNIESHLLLPELSHRSSSKASRTYCDGLLLGEFDSDSDPLPFADKPYLAQIYATPGPTYSTQFGPPHGDTLKPEYEATRTQLVTGNNHIDFYWRPFDRKRLEAPVLSKAPAFVADKKRSTIKTYSDNIAMESPQTGQFESIPPISPSPFSFSPLDVNDPIVPTPVRSAMYPESHDDPTDSMTPPLQMLPSAWVPAIYTPPLGLPPGRTPGSLSLAETGMFSKVKQLPKGEKNAISEHSFILPGLDSERSPSPLNSVEFWTN